MERNNYWHEGKGIAYFRCDLCRKPTSEAAVHTEGGCGFCGGKKFRPTTLTFFEKALEIIKRPSLLLWLFK